MNAADRINDMKQLGVAAVARAFGAAITDKLGVTPCPACGATVRVQRTARKNAPPVNIKADGGRVFYCFECEEGGSAFDFASFRVLGHRAKRDEYAEVIRECAARGLCGGALRDPSSLARLSPLPQPVCAPPAPLPNPAEVAAVWAAGVPFHQLARTDPSRVYLERRGFDSDRLTWAGDMVRVMPSSKPPLPQWWPSSWCESHPILFPAYDAHGSFVSLHARANEKNSVPKTRWPKGRSLGGVFFADDSGLNFLKAWQTPEQLIGLEAIVIVEGATDTLKAAQALESSPVTWGVLGYCSGSRKAIEQIAWPASLPCIIAVDDDAAGDAYALEVRRALPHALVSRVRPPKRLKGQKRWDWSEISDEAVLDAFASTARWEVLP